MADFTRGFVRPLILTAMIVTLTGPAGAQEPSPFGPPGTAPSEPAPLATPVQPPSVAALVPNQQFVLSGPGPASIPPPVRFQFKIDPDTPLKDLMPRPPKAAARKPALIDDDLTQVPQIDLLEFPSAPVPAEKALEQVAHQIAKINHVNRQGSDKFMRALLDQRGDLRGLPFLLGDACRTKGDRSRDFTVAVQLVRNSALNGGPRTPEEEENLWTNFRQQAHQFDRVYNDDVALANLSSARIAAMMQMMGPVTEKSRLNMVKFLASVSHIDSTRALAKLAIFAPEVEVRTAAISALQTRRERDYTDILMAGFHYPWPPVQRRAADALVKLDRKDLVEELVAILDEPDPRAPFTKESDGKPVTALREVVRINHHRNCLLCHAPVEPDKVSGEMLTAPVAAPGLPLPSPSQGYGSGPSPDVLVRIDVTYLRQDFSLMQPVADAHPWPEMQRFDFLVRTRELSDDEAEEYRKLLKPEPGVLPPNHRAALLALREMTGKDAAPTAEAWRKLLATADR